MVGSVAIEPAGSNFNNKSFNVVGYDRMLNGGTMALIDIGNANLYPAQNNTFTGVANAVPGSGATAYNPPGAGAVTLAGGGMDFNSSVGGTPGLSVGGAADFDLALLDASTEILYINWLKATAAAGTTHALGGICEPGTTTAGEKQIMLSRGSGGALGLDVCNQSAPYGLSPVTGTIYQVASHIAPNPSGKTRVTQYINGVKVGIIDLTYAAYDALESGGLAFGSRFYPSGYAHSANHRLYRMVLENLTLSTRDPARQVARDYALNAGRFT